MSTLTLELCCAVQHLFLILARIQFSYRVINRTLKSVIFSKSLRDFLMQRI